MSITWWELRSRFGAVRGRARLAVLNDPLPDDANRGDPGRCGCGLVVVPVSVPWVRLPTTSTAKELSFPEAVFAATTDKLRM